MITRHIVSLRPADYGKLPPNGVYIAEIVDHSGQPAPIGRGTWIPELPQKGGQIYPLAHSSVINIGRTDELRQRDQSKQDLFDELLELNLPAGYFIRITMLEGYEAAFAKGSKDADCELLLLCCFAIVTGGLPILNGIPSGGSHHLRARRVPNNNAHNRGAVADIIDREVFREIVRCLFSGMLSATDYGRDCDDMSVDIRVRALGALDFMYRLKELDTLVQGQPAAPCEILLNTAGKKLKSGQERFRTVDCADIYLTAPAPSKPNQVVSDAFAELADRLERLRIRVGITGVGTDAMHRNRKAWHKTAAGYAPK